MARRSVAVGVILGLLIGTLAGCSSAPSVTEVEVSGLWVHDSLAQLEINADGTFAAVGIPESELTGAWDPDSTSTVIDATGTWSLRQSEQVGAPSGLFLRALSTDSDEIRRLFDLTTIWVQSTRDGVRMYVRQPALGNGTGCFLLLRADTNPDADEFQDCYLMD